MRVLLAVSLLAVLAMSACKERRPLAAASHASSQGSTTSRWPADSGNQLVPLMVGNAAARGAVPECTPLTPVVTQDSIGPVHPGERLQDLYQRCPPLLYGWDW